MPVKARGWGGSGLPSIASSSPLETMMCGISKKGDLTSALGENYSPIREAEYMHKEALMPKRILTISISTISIIW